MKWSTGWFACLCVLALFGPACSGDSNGSGDKLVEDYMPASGAITGWDEDSSKGEPGVQAFYTRDAAEYEINGALDPFTETGKWVAMAMEHYTNGNVAIELQIYEMQDAAACQAVLDHYRLPELGYPWEETGPGIGDQGDWCDQGPYWLIHAVKGKYFVMTQTSDDPDDDAKDPAKAFTSAVLADLP